MQDNIHQQVREDQKNIYPGAPTFINTIINNITPIASQIIKNAVDATAEINKYIDEKNKELVAEQLNIIRPSFDYKELVDKIKKAIDNNKNHIIVQEALIDRQVIEELQKNHIIESVHEYIPKNNSCFCTVPQLEQLIQINFQFKLL